MTASVVGTYIGIDPGLGGGIAVIEADGKVLETTRMPATEQEVLDFLRQWTLNMPRAVLEFVRASPQMGVTSAFTFGRGYGGLRMALVAAKIPFDEVVPGVWQRELQCRTRGDKNVSKRRAQELFPHVTVTHKIADALLLAEYARRKERGHA